MAELGEISRFNRARELMGYSGAVSSEHSSGERKIAWKAQHRLHKRYRNLVAAGKEKQKVITAVERELLGFIWAIGVQVERNSKRVA